MQTLRSRACSGMEGEGMNKFYIALHTDEPTDEQSNELSCEGYARVSADFESTEGGIQNKSQIIFPEMNPHDPIALQYVGIYSESGHLLFSARISTTIFKGTTAIFEPGNLTIEDDCVELHGLHTLFDRLFDENLRLKSALEELDKAMPCGCDYDGQCDYCFAKDRVKEILDGNCSVHNE